MALRIWVSQLKLGFTSFFWYYFIANPKQFPGFLARQGVKESKSDTNGSEREICGRTCKVQAKNLVLYCQFGRDMGDLQHFSQNPGGLFFPCLMTGIAHWTAHVPSFPRGKEGLAPAPAPAICVALS